MKELILEVECPNCKGVHKLVLTKKQLKKFLIAIKYGQKLSVAEGEKP